MWRITDIIRCIALTIGAVLTYVGAVGIAEGYGDGCVFCMIFGIGLMFSATAGWYSG